VAITGGGGSGLAAAWFLLKAGHDPKRITVRERAPQFGGHARTIYLHGSREGPIHAIQRYAIRIEGAEPFLVFRDHTDREQQLSLTRERSVVPVDVGVCGFSVNYHNFRLLAAGIAPTSGPAVARYDYAEHVSFGVQFGDLTLRSDKLFFGQTFRPRYWYPTFRLWWDTQRAVRYCQQKGMDYWRQRTTRQLAAEWKALSISDTALASLFAFCQVGSGYTAAEFADVSAAYWLSFFLQGNFHNFGAHNTIFTYGVSAYVAGLMKVLTDAGVTLAVGEGQRGRHTILAVQPYDACVTNRDLPQVRASRAVAYVHRDASLPHSRELNTVLEYGQINGIAQASWDVDAMRPNHPDIGAFVTFTPPDHEAEVDRRLFGGSPARILTPELGNTHDLSASAFKIAWRHALVDVPAEAARQRIWAEHQGRDDTWYCGSSYQGCMLHESAVTSALDVVCRLTGREAELRALGFKPSDLARPG
jgi:hypothetical protein